jgi:hypothetical protein
MQPQTTTSARQVNGAQLNFRKTRYRAIPNAITDQYNSAVGLQQLTGVNSPQLVNDTASGKLNSRGN